MQSQIPVNRIHHISLAARQADRTSRFYVDLLGLHASDWPLDRGGSAPPSLFLTDDSGTNVTITESAEGPAGSIGIGTVHHAALAVASFDALLKWKRWLQHNEVLVYGPYDQQAYGDIIFTDPDGVLLEIATQGPGWDATRDGEDVYFPPRESMAPYRDEAQIRIHSWPQPVTSIEPDMVLQGFHHISTIVSSLDRADHFYRGALGLPLVRKTLDHDDPEVEHWYWGLDEGRPGTVITAFPIIHEREGGKAVYGRAGVGVIDRFALEVDVDEQTLASWGATAANGGVEVTSLAAHSTASVSLHTPDGQVMDLVTSTSTR